ncbi:MAG: methylmalonyl-CoA epimerase [Sphingobacteriales bacterium]|nr:MAG: methylmalonyl-CoA epimerase [Sphingobacteriales bacterium]
MFRKIEHIGIAVKDLESANNMFSQLAEIGLLKMESVESEGVKVSFFQVGETKIEFLQATNPESPIAKFIEKNGEGIHHIAFDVENVGEELEKLQEKGFKLIHAKPKEGADNKLIAFLHPQSTHRVLVELCQENLSSKNGDQ